MLKTNIDPNDQEINYLEAGVGNLPLFFFFFSVAIAVPFSS